MAQYKIQIPDALAERMAKAMVIDFTNYEMNVNWDEVACKAFLKKLDQLAVIEKQKETERMLLAAEYGPYIPVKLTSL